jgi:Haem-degrading
MKEMAMHTQKLFVSGCFGVMLGCFTGPALAAQSPLCATLPTWGQLKTALTNSVTPSTGANGGLGFNMWGTIVAADGTVCAVAFSGSDYTTQWFGSRVISAQKASTGNDFSLGNGSAPGGSAFPTGLALSTANLYSAVQPGGSLFGLQASNPVDTDVAYANTDNGSLSPSFFGTKQDPLVGLRVGGVNVFGGGLGAYQGGVRVGGVGVSGDTSCTDHMVAWRLRHRLGLDQFGSVTGVSGDPKHPDNIIFDITPNPYGGTGISKGGFGHPTCLNNPTPAAVSGLPAVQ